MDFFDGILLILLLLTFMLSLLFAGRHFIHMFQLNGYKPRVQVIWLKKNLYSAVPKLLLSALTVPAIALWGKTGLILSGIVYVILAYFYKPRQAKKPLVYTKRVIRLCITLTLIEAVILVVCICFCANRLLLSLLLFLSYALLPFLILAANYINKPVEKGINRKFINQARSMLAAMPDLKVIGITGSYGKTSVKYYLSTLLRAKYDVLMTPENYNTTLGVVRTIRENLRATHEVFVCEMGARNVGDIREICDLVHPQYGVVTAIGEQHLESFKSLNNIQKTKFELPNSLPEDGMAFLNGDDENIKSVAYSRPHMTYGLQNGNGYHASDIEVTEKGTSFCVKTPDGQTQAFTTRLLGRHNVLNITGAIAVAHSMGIDLKALAMQVKKLDGVPHRLQLLHNGQNLIIDDAYNSNPNGTKVALETLSFFKDSVKILVTPGMVELGEKQDLYNRRFGEDAAAVCDYIILVGRKQTQSIKAGALSKGFPADRLVVTDGIREAFDEIAKINTGDRQKVTLLENDLPDNF